MKNIQKSYFKKFVSIVLIVSMLFTTSGMATCADSIGEIIENAETETIKSSEDEVATVSESDLVDANDITSEINIDEQIDTNIVETENNEIATISIVDEGIVNLVKINDEIASSSDISNDIEEKATSILATESETILDIEKSSESEIKLDDAPLFGDAAPDTIWLGTYPQSATWQSDGSAYNIVEPIKWRKLSESGTEALYVADKLLDNVSYHVDGVSVTWGTSDIRSWINDTSVNGFVGKAFTTNQLDDADGIVLEKTITTGGNDTNDRVFLLSENDANNLFVDNNARKAQGTVYAKSVVNDGSTIFVDGNGNSRYWLRETTYVPTHYNAYIVHSDGTVVHNPVDAKIHGVRPAIYINLSSPLYKTSNNGVSWDLNGGAFNTNSTLWNEYTSYFGGQALPTAYNFTPPTGKYFVAMSVNAEKSRIATLSIPDNQDGDITLEALWGDTEDDKAISYDFGAGSISDWSLLPRVYTPGTAKSLPDRHDLSTYITHPSGYPFAGFAKSGTTDIITEIAETETENITLVPIWGPYIEYYESASDTVATVSILRNVDGSGTIAAFPSDLIPSWVRTGYDFVQWRDKTTGAAITNLNIAAGNMNDIEVYPEWREHPLPPDTIWLGTYPQSVTWQSDGSAYNIVEPIKWRKLSHNDTEALYVADKILDNVSYHAAGGAITWAGSGIHTWLNDTSANGFIGKAFTTNQLDNTNGIVLEKTITTTDSADINDKAFLLSVDEVQNLVTPASSRRAYGTEYAKTKSNGGPTLEIDSEHSPWWLRSPGSVGQEYAAHVRASGLLMTSGGSVNSQTIGARPAIYINLDSPLYKTSDNGVTWDLNGGRFATKSQLWNSMNTYFGGQSLPTADNFIPPDGKYFIGMSISTATKSSVNTVIPDDQEGNITLKPLFGDHATDKVISYDFGAGSISDWSLLPRVYTPGTVKTLPNRHDLSTYITHPSGYPFAGFAKSGTTDIITEISDLETEDITLVPVWGVCIEYYEQATDTIATASILRNADGSGTIATYPWDVKPSWVRTGYDFVQWRDKTTGVAITDLNIAAGNMGDIEIYPEWYERPPAPDTIWLGTYPQNDTTGAKVEPIKWRKLSQNDTEALYIADKILDNVSYYTNAGSVTWEGSLIHSWLNDTSATGFIGKAFTTNQLDDTNGIVLEKTIQTQNSHNTNDKAFLLSIDEATNLFVDADARKAFGTEYAKNKNNGGSTLYIYSSGNSTWWLRSPGNNASYARTVDAEWDLFYSSDSVDAKIHGVRPAIYINLLSPLYKTSDNGVSWDLNGGRFATKSQLWNSMNTYFGGQALPTADNFIVPTGKYFIGVSINTETKSTINTIIPDDLEGDITLKPLFGNSATDKTINYDFGAGVFTGWSLLPGNYTPGNAQPLPTKSDLVRYITPPADKEFKGFAKEGTTNIITEIADTETNDINLVAIYRDRPTITWNMGSGIDIGTLEPEAASPSYISGIEWQLPSQDKITPPNGCEFDHWILRRAGAPDINPATIIPETLDVNVEIIAVYNPLTYNITWDMGTGSDGGTLDPIVASASYTHGTSYSLPTSDKITPPVGREFDHWKIIQTGSGEPSIEPATNIAPGQWGDITIKAVYNNLTFPITWILNGATIDEALMPAEHTYGTAIPLPNVTNVTPPEGKAFNYWLVNGTKATSISANLVGNVTVTLVLKDKSPSPSPYYPPSGGGGSSGGGGNVNYAMQSQVIPTTYIDQIKTLKASVDSKQISWVYDPIANSFKMNITIEGQTIPAIDGFYLVNKTNEQNINGSVINTLSADTYYFDKDGKMLTGWIKTTPDNKWYFLESIKNAREGAMVFGWYKVQNDWYYFTKEGSMLVNATTPDGQVVGPDGRWIQ